MKKRTPIPMLILLLLTAAVSVNAQEKRATAPPDTLHIDMEASRKRMQKLRQQKADAQLQWEQRRKRLHKLPKAPAVVPDTNDVNIPERVTR